MESQDIRPAVIVKQRKSDQDVRDKYCRDTSTNVKATANADEKAKGGRSARITRIPISKHHRGPFSNILLNYSGDSGIGTTSKQNNSSLRSLPKYDVRRTTVKLGDDVKDKSKQSHIPLRKFGDRTQTSDTKSESQPDNTPDDKSVHRMQVLTYLTDLETNTPASSLRSYPRSVGTRFTETDGTSGKNIDDGSIEPIGLSSALSSDKVTAVYDSIMVAANKIKAVNESVSKWLNDEFKTVTYKEPKTSSNCRYCSLTEKSKKYDNPVYRIDENVSIVANNERETTQDTKLKDVCYDYTKRNFKDIPIVRLKSKSCAAVKPSDDTLTFNPNQKYPANTTYVALEVNNISIGVNKDFQYPSTGLIQERPHVPSYTVCPSEVLQKTTNFECFESLTNSSPVTDLERDNFSSQFTIEHPDEYAIMDAWCPHSAISQNNGSFMKCTRCSKDQSGPWAKRENNEGFSDGTTKDYSDGTTKDSGKGLPPCLRSPKCLLVCPLGFKQLCQLCNCIKCSRDQYGSWTKRENNKGFSDGTTKDYSDGTAKYSGQSNNVQSSGSRSGDDTCINCATTHSNKEEIKLDKSWFPSKKYNISRQFRLFRRHRSRGPQHQRRWIHVWKKKAKWSNWSRAPFKFRKFRMMHNLQRSIIWEDVDVQTNVLVFREIGTGMVLQQLKSAGITTSASFGFLGNSMETASKRSSFRMRPPFKHVNLGPSRFPFGHNTSTKLKSTSLPKSPVQNEYKKETINRRSEMYKKTGPFDVSPRMTYKCCLKEEKDAKVHRSLSPVAFRKDIADCAIATESEYKKETSTSAVSIESCRHEEPQKVYQDTWTEPIVVESTDVDRLHESVAPKMSVGISPDFETNLVEKGQSCEKIEAYETYFDIIQEPPTSKISVGVSPHFETSYVDEGQSCEKLPAYETDFIINQAPSPPKTSVGTSPVFGTDYVEQEQCCTKIAAYKTDFDKYKDPYLQKLSVGISTDFGTGYVEKGQCCEKIAAFETDTQVSQELITKRSIGIYHKLSSNDDATQVMPASSIQNLSQGVSTEFQELCSNLRNFSCNLSDFNDTRHKLFPPPSTESVSIEISQDSRNCVDTRLKKPVYRNDIPVRPDRTVIVKNISAGISPDYKISDVDCVRLTHTPKNTAIVTTSRSSLVESIYQPFVFEVGTMSSIHDQKSVGILTAKDQTCNKSVMNLNLQPNIVSVATSTRMLTNTTSTGQSAMEIKNVTLDVHVQYSQHKCIGGTNSREIQTDREIKSAAVLTSSLSFDKATDVYPDNSEGSCVCCGKYFIENRFSNNSSIMTGSPYSFQASCHCTADAQQCTSKPCFVQENTESKPSVKPEKPPEKTEFKPSEKTEFKPPPQKTEFKPPPPEKTEFRPPERAEFKPPEKREFKPLEKMEFKPLEKRQFKYPGETESKPAFVTNSRKDHLGTLVRLIGKPRASASVDRNLVSSAPLLASAESNTWLNWCSPCCNHIADLDSFIDREEDNFQTYKMISRVTTKKPKINLAKSAEQEISSQDVLSPFENLSKISLAEEVSIAKNRKIPKYTEMSAYHSGQPDVMKKQTPRNKDSDTETVKELKESILQTHPEFRDAGTSPIYNQRSAGVLTSQCLLPSQHICYHYPDVNPMDCILVYEPPHCTLHAMPHETSTQKCCTHDTGHKRKRKEDISAHSIGLLTSCLGMPKYHETPTFDSEIIGDVLSPKVYKSMYKSEKSKERETNFMTDNGTETFGFISAGDDVIMRDNRSQSTVTNGRGTTKYVPSGHGIPTEVARNCSNNNHARVLYMLPFYDQDSNEDYKKGTCRYYSHLLSKQFVRVKENLKHLRATDECVYRLSTMRCKTACTMIPSGRVELCCQTSKRQKPTTPLSQCVMTPSVTNIGDGQDKKHLKDIYYMLTAIEGRIRRLRHNIHN